MSVEDNFLKAWVDQLKTMQECMRELNTDTDPALENFYAQKHADLLLSDLIRQTFCSNFQDRTNIAISDEHFTNCATFHELLDRCFRLLPQGIVIVIRAVAVAHDATLASIPEESFGTVPAARAVPAGVMGELSIRLARNLSPLYRAGSAAERRLREAAAKPGATVQTTALAIV